MPNYTPGPWQPLIQTDERSRVREISVRAIHAFEKSTQMADFRGAIVCHFFLAHGNRPHAYSESEANARLIAAAPDLLEAIKGLVKVFHDDQAPKDAICMKEVEVALRAITKAEGDSEADDHDCKSGCSCGQGFDDDPDPNPEVEGMSLRDWFAGMALQGLLQWHGMTLKKEASLDDAINDFPQGAYNLADAMLKVRES